MAVERNEALQGAHAARTGSEAPRLLALYTVCQQVSFCLYNRSLLTLADTSGAHAARTGSAGQRGPQTRRGTRARRPARVPSLQHVAGKK